MTSAYPAILRRDAIHGVRVRQRGYDLFRQPFGLPPSPEGDLEKPHFAANFTSENPVKQGFFAKYCLRKQGFSKLP